MLLHISLYLILEGFLCGQCCQHHQHLLGMRKPRWKDVWKLAQGHPVVDWYLTHVIWLLAFSQRHYWCLSGSLTASYSMALPFAAEEQMPKFLHLNIQLSRHGVQIKESAQGRLAAMAYPTGAWDK